MNKTLGETLWEAISEALSKQTWTTSNPGYEGLRAWVPHEQPSGTWEPKVGTWEPKVGTWEPKL